MTADMTAAALVPVAPQDAGVPRARPAGWAGTADPGLFGPHSVSWRVHGDPLMAVGGLRALLLQSLHPVVAHGFAAHSGYREESWGRLLRTADYVSLTTFGSTAQVEAVAGHVRRAHAGSEFVDPGDGSRRRIDEPELLLWVHTCLVDSVLVTTRRGGLDLTEDEADTFVAEQVRAGELLGVDPAAAPRSQAGVAAYLAGVRGSLHLSAPARDAVAMVLAPPIHPLLELLTPARLGWSSLAGLAFATLPAWARDMFPAPLRTGGAVVPQAAVTSSLRALRRTGRRVGSVVPALAQSHHEAQARRRLGLG
ncbi:oxygenase MpaB family protein [Aquipuribacter hungaricus]|uniref:Oxygenase MpaB family protein n=1 Tax=Aquipuribacter hungaricus TaxID=545624 RepID=A0ABV7WBF2_9MICO